MRKLITFAVLVPIISRSPSSFLRCSAHRLYTSDSKPSQPRKGLGESPVPPRSLQSVWKERLAKLDALFLTGVTRFHEITGYSEIEKMKEELLKIEDKLSKTRIHVKEAREEYNTKLSERSSSQNEMNELLMRKQTWMPNDLERFTQLYKNDHQIQMGVLEAKQKYDDVESQAEELQQYAGKLIGARYREEQLWSDKIRQASTWGTWVLMGINILLFVLVQLILEPWKRRRLVRAFESKVENMLDERLAATSEDIDSAKQQTKNSIKDIQGEAADARPTESFTKSSNLNWSTLKSRLTTDDHYHLKPVVELRPIELGALALGFGTAVVGTLSLVVSSIWR